MLILLKKLLRIARQPFVLFWLYYFIGPIIRFDIVHDKSLAESLFSEDELIPNFLRHTTAYLSLLPLIVYCAGLNLSHKNRTFHIRPRFAIVLPAIVLLAIFLFFTMSAFDLRMSIFLPDTNRARIYIQWIQASRIMPMLLMGITIGLFFFGPWSLFILGIPAVALDVIMGRRHIMLLFLYPLLSRISPKTLLVIILLLGIFSSTKHGLDNIATNVEAMLNAIFSESYMIFLSSTNHGHCSIVVESIYKAFHFERFTEDCRILQGAAGGFSARFQYDILFGIVSVVLYSFIFWLVVTLFYRLILPIFHEVLGIVIFISLFIAYRDDLGNSLSYLFQYVAVLWVVSIALRQPRADEPQYSLSEPRTSSLRAEQRKIG